MIKIEKGNMNEEEINEEELKVFKKKERVFNHFFTPEEQRTILGLLEGKKRKKVLKNKKEKNV